MIDSKGKLRNNDGVLFCFLAAMIIAIAALNIGLLTEPDKILPKGLSMRTDELNSNLLRGIDLALEDIAIIKSGVGSNELWRLLTFIHLDLFFYLALILPEAAAKTILTLGFYVRFGLCCSAMYYFLSEHIKLNRLPSALLGVMYAFSSQLIFTAQFASVMNMAIMMPVLMSAFDSYLQKRTWKSYFLVCLCSFGLCASGGFGVISGIPVMILISLLMCISLYRSFGTMFVSWLKLLAGILVGLFLDAAFVIPGFLPMDIDVNIAESLKNARVTYTVFDLIRGMFLLRSGNISVVGTPIFYIGTVTVAAIVLFALNERIPLRLKVASGLVVAVIHITCSSSFVNETVSVFGTAPLINSSKLICMEVVLFFIAGIGLKNVKSLKRGDYIASALIPLFFLVVSNVDAAGTTLASPIMVVTFIGIITSASAVYAISTDRLTNVAKGIILILGFVFVGVNSAFVMFNNTIPSTAVEEYFKGYQIPAGSSELAFDKDFELPAIGDNNKYLVVPENLSKYEPSESPIDDINLISERISGERLFEEVFTNIDDISGFTPSGIDRYKISAGRNVLVISPYVDSAGDRLFAYCSAADGAQLKVNADIGDSERVFGGPFISEINAASSDFTLRFTVHSEGEGSCFVAVYKLNENAYRALMAVSGNSNASSFMVNNKNSSGINTLVLPFSYNDSKIKINGTEYDTFCYCGKTAVTFDAGESSSLNVSFKEETSGIIPGVLISITAALCLIAIPVIQRYNDKKKAVTAEGNNTNA